VLYLELVYCLLLLFCLFVLLQLLFERVYLVVGVLENLESSSLPIRTLVIYILG
jgi:hypothetical protein